MSSFREPEVKPDFSQIDNAITQWWKENHVFEKSVKLREGAKEYIFYDGPPFMSGMPHYATLLSSLPKDVIPRYQTMKGKHVERLWGWDCHGLPIENKVEADLNLHGRKDILTFGLEPFISKCYEWNRVGIDNWRWYIDKIGRWADIDNAYRTMDQDYMESIWWTFKEIWNKGLVYEGKRISLFSTDSSTPVSNFEVSMDMDNYRDTEDIAVTVKFKLTQKSYDKLNKKVETSLPMYMLAWTTTPWTLPSNVALGVNPEAEYVAVQAGDEVYLLAKARVEAVFGNREYVTVAGLKSEDLAGLHYEQLYSFLQGGKNDFQVYQSDYVTTEDGTGILHIAPAFGEQDFDLGQKFELSQLVGIDDAGIMQAGPWSGTYIRQANPLIVDDLSASGKLFQQENFIHRLPYYRYDNPLIYKIQNSYFIDVQRIKQQLINTAEDINWVPEYFKEGRFLNVLETAPDWSISRSRFWGTVMPIWQSEDGEKIIVGSRDELMYYVNNSENDLYMQKVVLELDGSAATQDFTKQLNRFIASKAENLTIKANQEDISTLRSKFFGETETEAHVKPLQTNEQRTYYLISGKPLDMHRPYIDQIFFVINSIRYDRVLETLDVWMDSGSMPFAQFHYPFVNKEKFEKSFPGDFIAEYTGQIRAWFNVLHTIANALFGKPAFKNVLVTGVLAGTDGRKMSKSFHNYPDPKETLEKYGAEALRLYMLGSPIMSGNDMNFSETDLQMQVREFLIPLWNIFKYFVTYANVHEWQPRPELAYNSRTVFDDPYPWGHIPFEDVAEPLDAWILALLEQTIGEVTMRMDKYEIPAAIKALGSFINECSKWYIRRSRNRFNTGETAALDTLYYVLVEFCKLAAPIVPFTTEHIYREIVSSSLQEVPESIHLNDYPRKDEDFFAKHKDILDNMRIVRAICDLGQMLRASAVIKVRQPLAKLEVKFAPDKASAGADLSPWMMSLIADELNVLEVVETADFTVSDSVKTITDSQLGITIALETKLTPELEDAGLLREIVRSIQAARKNNGFHLGELVKITYETDSDKLKSVINNHLEGLQKIVTASEIVEGTGEKEVKINEFTMKIKLEK